MKIINQYLTKQGKNEGIIEQIPSVDLELIVVIPAYKEEDIVTTLQSLSECVLPEGGVEVLIYVNGALSDSTEERKVNEQCYKDCLDFAAQNKNGSLNFFVFSQLELSKKESGVGRARKTLMDEALYRFSQIGKQGIIVNLDADCLVQQNYFHAIVDYFLRHPTLHAASIHYEHDLNSEAIVDYELHLRYFIGMQRLIGFPFAFQTVGSAMAVRAGAYAAVGGMNTRQAGEDFYFLHKFIKNDSCGSLPDTTVVPSGRISDRVPFGTGRAIGEINQGNEQLTYDPNSFLLMKPLVSELMKIYKGEKIEINENFRAYLSQIKFEEKVDEIVSNTKTFEAFRKRFYQFFDAFQLMKCLHFFRDEGYADVSLDKALAYYLDECGYTYSGNRRDALVLLREVDKKREMEA